MTTVSRFDQFQIDAKNVKKTPSGGIRVNAFLSRTGMQTYLDSTGKKLIEYRPDEEVFDSASIESFKGAPVTDGHPRTPVNPSNWGSFTKGHVSDRVNPVDNKFVGAEILIQDQNTVEDVLSGNLTEISCGYTCDLELTDGEIDGQHYDAVQRNIKINHVALLPAGHARGGRELTVRFDSKGNLIMPEEEKVTQEETAAAPAQEEEAVVTDEAEEEVNPLNELKTRVDALEAKLEDFCKPAEEKKDEAEVVEEVEKVDVDALVQEKLTLIDSARTLADGVDFKGMTVNQIKLAALEANKVLVAEENKDNEAYLCGAFEVLTQIKEQTKPATQKADEIQKKLDKVQKTSNKSEKLAKLQEQWAGRLNKGAN